MEAEIKGAPSFSHIHFSLAPGEFIYTESDAMASMDARVDLRSKMNGGFFRACMMKFLGNETFFISKFINKSEKPSSLIITQGTPGDIYEHHLEGKKDELFIQPGSFLCRTPGVKVKLKWAGLRSWFAGEGLFRMKLCGRGKCWISCFGSVLKRKIVGEHLIDTGHLLAYPPSIKLKLQLAGGIFSSFFGGEGFVARMEGEGEVLIQSRSLDGMAGWLNPLL
jgi:uncharacterized protein (TIGR00266 family)